MTKLLKEAFERASALSPKEQDAVAQWLLAELGSDAAWDEKLAASQSELERLAEEALQDHRAGRTTKLDPDAL